jgi:4-hydroxybenzoate polyprenyltransferase
VGAAGLACGLIYDVSLKRTALSWLPLSIALPLVPAWVFLAAGEWRGLLWWAFPLGVLFGLALHLANQAPDVHSGNEPGVHGAAHRMGARRAALLAVALYGVATSATVLVLVFVAPARSGLVAAAGGIFLLLAPRASRFFGRDGLFGLMAMTTAIIAVVFLSAA